MTVDEFDEKFTDFLHRTVDIIGAVTAIILIIPITVLKGIVEGITICWDT
jgi:SNF family Na+-dependent transporter